MAYPHDATAAIAAITPAIVETTINHVWAVSLDDGRKSSFLGMETLR
jgi:hypothetical protein